MRDMLREFLEEMIDIELINRDKAETEYEKWYAIGARPAYEHILEMMDDYKEVIE